MSLLYLHWNVVTPVQIFHHPNTNAIPFWGKKDTSGKMEVSLDDSNTCIPRAASLHRFYFKPLRVLCLRTLVMLSGSEINCQQYDVGCGSAGQVGSSRDSSILCGSIDPHPKQHDLSQYILSKTKGNPLFSQIWSGLQSDVYLKCDFTPHC